MLLLMLTPSSTPQYIILNLGLAPGFQKQDFKHLVFPSKMYVDYVRVYQRAGTNNGVTCDPPKRTDVPLIKFRSCTFCSVMVMTSFPSAVVIAFQAVSVLSKR